MYPVSLGRDFVHTLVVLYLMSSASPSGGMKLIACSDSNLDSFTHLEKINVILLSLVLVYHYKLTGGTDSHQWLWRTWP